METYCPICNYRKKIHFNELFICPKCNELLQLNYVPNFNIKKIQKNIFSIWRYKEFIPINNKNNIITLGEGWTPLIELIINNQKVFIKEEQLSPSGSFKDRGASVLVSKIKENKITSVIEDSSGNAGAAISAYCANAEINTKIITPYKTSKNKIKQIKSYGADIININANRDDITSFTIRQTKNFFYSSHIYNPYFFQGTKTFVYELIEQLNWAKPDVIILPVGNGTIFIGAYIGIKELLTNGLIKELPKMVAVQTTNCCPIYTSILNKKKIKFKKTIAEGIAIKKPKRLKEIIKIIKETKGEVITVTEEEINYYLNKMNYLGYYIEPTSAVAIAGCHKLIEKYKPKGTIVSLFTGHGLKH